MIVYDFMTDITPDQERASSSPGRPRLQQAVLEARYTRAVISCFGKQGERVAVGSARPSENDCTISCHPWFMECL